MGRSPRTLVAALALWSVCSACGSRPVRIDIPHDKVDPLPRGTPSEVVIYLGNFTDARTDRDGIGQSRGGFGGLRRDRYVIDGDVPSLVRAAVKRGIEAQGHVVTELPGEANFAIEGRILRCSVDMAQDFPHLVWIAQVESVLEVRGRNRALVLKRSLGDDVKIKSLASSPGGRGPAGKALGDVLERLARSIAADDRLDSALRGSESPLGRAK